MTIVCVQPSGTSRRQRAVPPVMSVTQVPSRRTTGTGPLRSRLADRTLRACSQVIDYLPQPEFADPVRRQELERGCETWDGSQILAEAAPEPSDGSSYVAALYRTRLLTPGEEREYFVQFNFLKFLAEQARQQLDPAAPAENLLDSIDRWLAQAQQLRNRLVQANLRLVMSVAKKFANAENPLWDLVSDGHLTLFRAVEKFDPARGFRFSTYATWALRKNFQRALAKQRRERPGLLAHSDLLQNCQAQVDLEEGDSWKREHALKLVESALQSLGEREHAILVARFGLVAGELPQTLSAVGHRLGISKERVRQLESRALDKLRQWAARAAATSPGRRGLESRETMVPAAAC